MPATTRRNAVLRPEEFGQIPPASPPETSVPPATPARPVAGAESTAPGARSTGASAPARPPVARPRSWRVMNVLSRSRLLREAVGGIAHLRARARGYRWESEFVRPQATRALEPLDVRAAAARLRVDGFCEGLVLQPEIVDQLVAFALLGTCYGNSELRSGFAYADRQRAEAEAGRSFSLATYLFTDEVDSVIERIARDRHLRALVASYFGAPPAYLGRRLWWTLRTPQHLHDDVLTTCRFHYDRDDYRSVRVFFHLTAVDADHGQHVVVRGSHRRKALGHQLGLRALSDASIERFYGPARVARIEGPAGTGFVEDTYCYHKATRPHAGDRLMLELGFGLRNHRRYPPPDRASAAQIALPPAG